MSATLLKRAIEKQNRTWAQMQEIRRKADDEGRDLTGEERSAWDAAEADLSEASADIERFERAAKLDDVDRGQVDPDGGENRHGGGDTEKRYDEAFRAYIARGMGRLTVEQRELLEGNHVELRAQSSGSDAAGGFLVPDGFRNKMTEVMKAFGGVAQFAEEITTSTGNDLPWLTMDDTSNEGEILGENEQVGEQDVKFGGRKLKAHIFSSKMVKWPLALLQDAIVDVDSLMSRKLGERIGRRQARAWLTGTGVDEPEGLLTNATVGRTGANGQTTSIIWEDLVDLEHSIDPAYRTANTRYILADGMLKVLRKLKDGDDRPLWVPVPAPGMVSTINGRPYTVDNSMPVPAASAKTIIYGDIRAAYVIRRVRDVSMLRLNERYAEYLQAAFLSWARADGMVQDPNAYRVYQHAAS
ncbi:phage major capsid protein [Micromonospora haikouensis]|uniref:phage major capsid protein n=1 Tax=Micromonospora haikouensis TaxID=686309 RepID=UPI00378AC495